MNPFKNLKLTSPKRFFQTRKKPSSYSSSDSLTTTPRSVLPDVVSREELEGIFNRLGHNPPTHEDVEEMLRRVVGDNGFGSVNLDALSSGRVSSSGDGSEREKELRETFEFFDKNGDGRITAEELLDAFREIGDGKCSLEQCERMVAGVDRNLDGSVCFDEFCVMMMMEQQQQQQTCP